MLMQRLHPLRAKTRPTLRISAGLWDRNISCRIRLTNTPSAAQIQSKGLDMPQAHFYSKPTSVFWTCKALLDGRTISQLTQIQHVRGWRLPAIVHRLKTEFNWPICTEYRQPDGVALYSMPPDVDRSKLRFPHSAKALGAAKGCE